MFPLPCAEVSMEDVHGGSAAEEVRHYFLKREGSESSWSVKVFKFPTAALLLESTNDVASPSFRCGEEI
jgi:hypothetical protein